MTMDTQVFQCWWWPLLVRGLSRGATVGSFWLLEKVEGLWFLRVTGWCPSPVSCHKRTETKILSSLWCRKDGSGQNFMSPGRKNFGAGVWKTPPFQFTGRGKKLRRRDWKLGWRLHVPNTYSNLLQWCDEDHWNLLWVTGKKKGGSRKALLTG